MAWYAEFRRRSADGQHENWARLAAEAFETQERAKAECKALFEAEPNNQHRLEFRTVRNDDGATVEQVCQPPHAWRLKWVDSHLVG